MIITGNTSTKEFKLPPAGLHLARLYRIVDLGTQKVEWQGAVKMQHKLMFTFELLGDDDLKMDDGKPLIISKRYTMSLGEQSTLRKDLEAWRGHKMTPEELKAFDLTQLLGKFAMANVTLSERDGKNYANLAGLTQVPKAMQANAPQGVNELLIFDLANFDQTKFDSLSDGIKKIIEQSAEYRGSKGDPFAEVNAKLADISDDVPF